MIDIQIGDARNLIKEVEDKLFDCIMTSPPYWGLRDYGHDNQIGLETTPEEYLKTMLELFDDIKLKLKDTGNCFVNLGDTYWGGGNASGHTDDTVQFGTVHTLGKSYVTKPVAKGKDFQAKCLCMIPERFAWGMIEHGWILRNKIIWHKPNHMPESVTDRLTKSYEVIYHFVKQQKYYYNLDTIREPHATQSIERYKRSVQLGANAVNGKINVRDEQMLGYPEKAPKWFRDGQEPESFCSPRARAQRDKHSDNDSRTTSGLHENRWDEFFHENGKNPGDVWQINTQPYSEAHFAVFPIELVRRPILSGCLPGGHVLDPFGGSGTVAEFCRKNDRDCTIFELNPEYKELIKERSMQNTPPLEVYL